MKGLSSSLRYNLPSRGYKHRLYIYRLRTICDTSEPQKQNYENASEVATFKILAPLQ